MNADWSLRADWICVWFARSARFCLCPAPLRGLLGFFGEGIGRGSVPALYGAFELALGFELVDGCYSAAGHSVDVVVCRFVKIRVCVSELFCEDLILIIGKSFGGL